MLQQIWREGGSYILWFVSCALGILDLYMIMQAVGAVSIRLGADQWNFPAINRCTLMILAVVAVVFFLLSEHRYKKASEAGLPHLLRLFGWVTGGQIAIAIIAYLLVQISLLV